MKKLLLLTLLTFAGILGFSTAASAQDVTCDDLVWNAEVLANNPNIAEVCLGVVERGGESVAQFRARVVRQTSTSTIIQWQLPDGSWSPAQRRYPDRGFKANVGGQEVKIGDLLERQEVNVYVPSTGNWTVPAAAAAATTASAAPAATAAAAPVAAAAAAPEPEPEPEPEPVMLPTTATQLPLLALLGGVLLLLGGAVGILRTRL